MGGTPTTTTRQARFLPWQLNINPAQGIELKTEGLRQRSERCRDDTALRLEPAGGEQQAHGGPARRVSSKCQRVRLTSSPRRSISTPCSTRRAPCTPRE